MINMHAAVPRPRVILASGLFGLALAVSAAPAEAQIFGGIFAERFYVPLPGEYRGHYGQRYRAGIDAAAVVDLVRSEGFRRLTPPIYRGDVYVLEATDPRGARVRLFVDSYRGFIRGGQVIGRDQARGEPPPRRRETARVAPIPRDPPIFRAPDAPAAAPPPAAAPKILNAPDAGRPRPRPPVAARPAPGLPPEAPVTEPPKVLNTPGSAPRARPPVAARPAPQPAPAGNPPAAAPPATPRIITPETARPAPVQPRPPAQAQQPPRPSAPQAQPRRIDIGPPAALDDAVPQRRPAQPGINTIPPASLE